MKNIIFWTLCIVPILPILAQNIKEEESSDTRKWKVELVATYDFINASYGNNGGFIAKGKYRLLNTKHFELFGGLAYQNSSISETDNKFTDHVDGYTRDIGIYPVFEGVYFPFRKKTFYFSAESFFGLTHLKSKGTLDIPEHLVFEKYSNNHAYFNYGLSHSLGVKFNNVSLGVTLWSSLKGFLDGGRFRPGDFDSRLFAGLSVAYTF